MRIKSITLQDFRAFHDEAKIEFAHDDNSVNLIIAENEVGKTTILNSLLWCLYGKFTADSEESDKVINKISKRNGVTKARVTVELIDPSQYMSYAPDLIAVTRTHLEKDSTTILKIFKIDGVTGESSDIKSPKEFISGFCPEAISRYFFFDGEGMQKLTTNLTLLKHAIKSIQGLNAAEGALKDLEKFHFKRETDIRKNYKNNEALEKLSKKIEEDSGKLESLQKDKIADAQAKSDLELEKSQQNAIIGGLGTHKVTELQTNIKNLERSIGEDEARLKLWEVRKQKFVGKKTLAISSFHHADLLRKFIAEQESGSGLPSGYEETFVEGLLSKGICVCGLKFEEHDARYKAIENLLLDAKTNELDNKVFLVKSAFGEYRKEIESFNKGRVEIDDSIHHFTLKVKKDKENLEESKDILENTDVKAIKEAASKIKEIDDKIFEIARRTGRRDGGITTLSATINRDKKQKRSLSASNKFLANEEAELEFLDNSITSLTELIKEQESDGKQRITELMNEYLDRFARGNNRFIFRDGGYSPVILDAGAEEVDVENIDENDIAILSTGGAAVKRNLFFATSLTTLSKERSNDKSKFSIPGSIAPMVVDAPFSNLDTTNTVNLSKLLVSSADQLIIMISSSAYNNGFAETMKSPEHKKQLKTIHYLKRDYSGSNEGATAEEKRKKETPIIIDDTVYQTSFYTKPIESSYVVKVK